MLFLNLPIDIKLVGFHEVDNRKIVIVNFNKHIFDR